MATVLDDFEQNEILATLNGQACRAVAGHVHRRHAGGQASAAVKEWIAETQPSLPTGIELAVWFDTADVYENRMNLIAESSILGCCWSLLS